MASQTMFLAATGLFMICSVLRTVTLLTLKQEQEPLKTIAYCAEVAVLLFAAVVAKYLGW